MSATGYKIADGADLLTTFQNVLTTNGNTFSSPSNVFYGNGSNLTGLTGPANMVTTDAAQTITALKTFSGTTGGIQLTNCCIAGRTDNFGFTGIPEGTTFMPIGYTINHVSPPIGMQTSGSILYYTGLPFVDAGVWLVDGGINLLKGSAVYSTSSFISMSYLGVGGSFQGNSTLDWFTNASTTLGYNLPSKTFIATNTNRTSQVQPYSAITYTTAGGTYTYGIQMTKIA
jgi:hypothetical protein